MGRAESGQTGRGLLLDDFATRLSNVEAMAIALTDDLLSLERAWNFPGRVYTGRIPQDLQELLRQAFLPVLKLVFEQNGHPGEKQAWKLLGIIGHLMLPAISRRVVQRRTASTRAETRDHLRKSILRFIDMTPAVMMEIVSRPHVQGASSRKPKPISRDGRIARQAGKIRSDIGEGSLSRAAQALDMLAEIQTSVDPSICKGQPLPFTCEVQRQMELLHPKEDEPDPDDYDRASAGEQWVPRIKQIVRTVLQYDAKTAAGPGGITICMLKALVSDDDEHSSTPSALLTNIMSLIGQGRIIDDMKPILASARSMALSKGPGALKPRPAAMGDMVRRVFGRTQMRSSSNKLANHLGPMQRGVGISGGIEQVVLHLRLMLASDYSLVAAIADIVNAFNRLKRKALLAAKRKAFPELFEFSWLSYGKHSRLYFQTEGVSEPSFFSSECGAQQGATDGSADFAIALHPVLLTVVSCHPKVIITAIADDVQILGQKEFVAPALRMYKEELKALGLELHPTETEVFSHGSGTLMGDEAKKLFEGLATIVPADRGVIVLGVPIGSAAWTSAQLIKIVDKNRTRLAALPNLHSSQHAMQLLRNTCVTRIMHLTRSLSPSQMRETTALHDNDIWAAFSNILGVNTKLPARDLGEDWLIEALRARDAKNDSPRTQAQLEAVASTALKQARLPIGAGGFGLSSATEVAPFAYVGAFALAVSKGLLVDFPRLGALFLSDSPIPEIKELADTWASISHLVSDPTCTCGQSEHSQLSCLIRMSGQKEVSPQSVDIVINAEEPVVVKSFAQKLQHRLFRKAQRSSAEKLKSDLVRSWGVAPKDSPEANERNKEYGRLCSVSGGRSSAWLSALPSSDPGARDDLNLTSTEFQASCCFRLGIMPPEGSHDDLYICRNHPRVESVDRQGHHFTGMHCNHKGQHFRHDYIRSGLAVCARLAGSNISQVRIEPRQLVPGRNQRPADVFVQSHCVYAFESGNEQMCLDATAVAAMGVLNYGGSAPNLIEHPAAGKEAEKEEKRKTNEFVKNKKPIGNHLAFLACGVENLGAMGPGTLAAIDHLADCSFGASKGVDKDRDRFVWHCSQVLSVAAMRGVARGFYYARQRSFESRPRSSSKHFDRQCPLLDLPHISQISDSPSALQRRTPTTPNRSSLVAQNSSSFSSSGGSSRDGSVTNGSCSGSSSSSCSSSCSSCSGSSGSSSVGSRISSSSRVGSSSRSSGSGSSSSSSCFANSFSISSSSSASGSVIVPSCCSINKTRNPVSSSFISGIPSFARGAVS